MPTRVRVRPARPRWRRTRPAVRRLAAALALALLHPLAGAAAAQEAPAERARALFAELDGRPGPGVALAVVREGEVLLSEGYGFASLEHATPITPSTVFDLASLSKQFTGYAVAMLAERGALGLDDDIRRHLPELPDLGHRITVRHLLHHTSGLRDWPGTLAIAGWSMHDVISREQILAMAVGQRALNFTPGSEYTYSNTGYLLLAELVARVTGQSFRSWLDENLFQPLGMTRTHVHDDHTEVVPDRAFGYARAGDGGYRATPNNLTSHGSSSLFSTADDLARWLAHLDRPEVGGAGVMELTRTRGVLNDGSTIPYAFGLSHGEYRGAATLAHSGSWASFLTYLVHFPEQRLGVVVLSNGGGVNPTRAAYQLADLFLEGELEPSAPAPDDPDPAPAPVVPAALDAYVGTYRLGPGWYVHVRREGEELRVRATGEQEHPTVPLSEAEFRVPAYDASMTFVRDADGRVTHVRYRGRSAPRVEERPTPGAAELAAFTGEYVSEELETSYRVELREGSLVMRHRRHGTVPLAHAWGDDFRGSAWFLASVEFQRDATGRVVGLLVNAGERNRDLRFEKRPR